MRKYPYPNLSRQPCIEPTSLQPLLLSYRTLEDHVPQNHPLRKLRAVVDGILASMDEAFDTLYDNIAPSIPRE